MGKLESSAHVAQIVQSIAATIALAGAGWWFIEQRETYPRADLTQAVEVVPIGSGVIAVEVYAKLHNNGEKLIKLHRARVKLQEISATPFQYDDLANLHGAEYWEAVRPMKMPDMRQFNAGELRWPVLKVFDGAVDHHVEPSETDLMVFTFLVPCVRSVGDERRALQTVRIATDILKPEKEEGQEFAWKARGFVDVSEECRR